ncbi:hypothetical protein P376_4235 [Streptomyces sp. HCCB10043]|nr:hypothetical protein P376_4235 [Streptomyces sp. HCCB10043]
MCAGLLDLREEVAGDDDGPAPGRVPDHHVPHLADLRRVEPVGRLVEDQEVRHAEHGLGDGEPLPHALGVRPYGTGERVAEARDLQGLVDVRVLGGAAGGLPVQVEVGPPGEVRQEARALDEGAHPGEDRRSRPDGLPEDADLALVGGDEPHEHAQRGRLARAVGSQQPEHLALLDAEGQLAHGVPVDGLGVLLREPGDLERYVGEFRVRGGRRGPPPGGDQERGRDDERGGREAPGPPREGGRGSRHGGCGGDGQRSVQGHVVRGGFGRGRVTEVRRGEHEAQPVSGVELVVHGGQGQLDRLALLVGGDPVGGDELVGQDLLPAVRRHVVHLAEEHRVPVAVGLHVHRDGGRAGDAYGAVQRGGLEPAELSREVEREPDAEGGELGESAADAGHGRDGRRHGSGRVAEGLRPAAERDVPAAAAQPRVGVAARPAQEGGSVGGVDASGAGDAEGGPGGGAGVLLEVPVEPVPDASLDPARLAVAAVVAAGDPVHRYGCAVGADGLLHGVGLAEREEGVGLSLEEERGDLDAVGDGGRRTLGEEFDRLRVGLAADGDALVHLAEPLLELLAAAAGGDEDPGPELLEDPVGEEGVGEVPVGDDGGDGVDALVVPGGEQRDGPAVGGPGETDPGVALAVQLHLGPGRQPVDEPGDVLDLVVRVVEGDLPAGLPEAASRPGQHGVSVGGQLLGLGPDVVLAAAEPVPDEHGGPLTGTLGTEVRGVDRHPVHAQDPVLALHGGRAVVGDGGPGAAAHEHGERGADRGPPARCTGQQAPPSSSRGLHPSTLNGGRKPVECRQGEVRGLPERYGAPPPYSGRGTELLPPGGHCGHSPRYDRRGAPGRRPSLRRPAPRGVGGPLPRRGGPCAADRVRRRRPGGLRLGHRDAAPGQGHGDVPVRTRRGRPVPASRHRRGPDPGAGGPRPGAGVLRRVGRRGTGQRGGARHVPVGGGG